MRAHQGIVALYKERNADENIYGDPPTERVRGVQTKCLIIITRQHIWFFVRAGFEAAPWTRVNNYTVRRSRTFGSGACPSPRGGYQWLSDSS